MSQTKHNDQAIDAMAELCDKVSVRERDYPVSNWVVVVAVAQMLRDLAAERAELLNQIAQHEELARGYQATIKLLANHEMPRLAASPTPPASEVVE
jgi:hypothetical protein